LQTTWYSITLQHRKITVTVDIVIRHPFTLLNSKLAVTAAVRSCCEQNHA
jgi:hypothetical protein